MKKFKGYINHVSPTTLKSNSQAGQDLFVIAMLQGKQKGTFLEIGSGTLQDNNNTFLLEKDFLFSGTTIDTVDWHSHEIWQQEAKRLWLVFYGNVRDPSWPENPESINDLPLHIQEECRQIHQYTDLPKTTWENARPLTKFLKTDATTVDYSFLAPEIDYLQVDISPPMNNLLVLEKVLNHSKFSVVTFEHDLWRSTSEVRYVREESRKIMKEHGYVMIANDVTIEPGKGIGIGDQPIYFEDWYVHPDLVSHDMIETYSYITLDPFPKYYFDILLED